MHRVHNPNAFFQASYHNQCRAYRALHYPTKGVRVLPRLLLVTRLGERPRIENDSTGNACAFECKSVEGEIDRNQGLVGIGNKPATSAIWSDQHCDDLLIHGTTVELVTRLSRGFSFRRVLLDTTDLCPSHGMFQKYLEASP